MIRFGTEFPEADRISAVSVRYFLIFCLFYFSYLYFFPFSDGVSSAPPFMKALKDFIYIIFLASLAYSLPWSGTHGSGKLASLLFLPFALALILTSLLHAPHTSLREQLWQNGKNILLYVPLFALPFFLSNPTRRYLSRDVLVIVLTSGIVQCIFDIIYHKTGHTLWKDSIYAGLIGNPNSFSLLLNLGAAVVLAFLPRCGRYALWFSYAVLALFTYVILRTTSGSQFAILVFLLFYSLLLRPRSWPRGLTAVLICLSVTVWSNHLDSVMFTLKGFSSISDPVEDTTVSQGEASSDAANDEGSASEAELLPEQSVTESRSVSLRRKFWSETFATFKKGPSAILFGNFDSSSFKNMDGQYLVFMYNGGLITLVTFLLGAAVLYFWTLICSMKMREDVYLFSLHLMIVAFGITFVASRVLMYFPFNVIFFFVSGLALSLCAETKPLKMTEFAGARR